MNSQRRDPSVSKVSGPRFFRWWTVCIVVCPLLFANVWISSKERALDRRAAQLKKQFAHQEFQLRKLKSLTSMAKGLPTLVHHNRSLLWGKLRNCVSREDFLVRNGPLITWCELHGAPLRAQRVAVYVPEGSHRLVYASRQVQGAQRASQLRDFMSADRRSLADSVSVDLPDSQEVYEVRVSASAGSESKVRVVILGKDDREIHSGSFQIPSGMNSLQTHRTAFLRSMINAYPNEMSWRFAKNQGGELRMSPVIEILALSVNGTEGATNGMRLWIESDSPPCMSATDVAAYYATLAGKPQQGSASVGEKFNRLFQPYDGSGRYYLREEILSNPDRLADNE